MRRRQRRPEGFIVTVELLFIVTIMVIGLLVGWVAVRDATVAELHDTAEAIGSLDQSYSYAGTTGDSALPASTQGGLFVDEVDGPGSIFSVSTSSAGDGVAVSVILPTPDPEGIFVSP